jgi:hypothetical protein
MKLGLVSGSGSGSGSGSDADADLERDVYSDDDLNHSNNLNDLHNDSESINKDNLTIVMQPKGRSTSEICQALAGATSDMIKTGIVGATTYVAWSGIQQSRNIEGQNSTEIKHQIKSSFSHLSSVVSLGLLGEMGFNNLVFAGRYWDKLSSAQIALLVVSGAIGIAGAGFAGYHVGHESNTGSAGLAVATSMITMSLFNRGIALYNACTKRHEEEQNTSQEAVHGSILATTSILATIR